MFSRLPRPVLVLLALAGAGYAAQREVSWRQDVGEHMQHPSAEEIRNELRQLREEQHQRDLELQRQMLSFYRDWAEDRGYRDAARHYEQRLRELKERKP